MEREVEKILKTSCPESAFKYEQVKFLKFGITAKEQVSRDYSDPYRKGKLSKGFHTWDKVGNRDGVSLRKEKALDFQPSLLGCQSTAYISNYLAPSHDQSQRTGRE